MTHNKITINLFHSFFFTLISKQVGEALHYFSHISISLRRTRHHVARSKQLIPLWIQLTKKDLTGRFSVKTCRPKNTFLHPLPSRTLLHGVTAVLLNSGLKRSPSLYRQTSVKIPRSSEIMIGNGKIGMRQ